MFWGLGGSLGTQEPEGVWGHQGIGAPRGCSGAVLGHQGV